MRGRTVRSHLDRSDTLSIEIFDFLIKIIKIFQKIDGFAKFWTKIWLLPWKCPFFIFPNDCLFCLFQKKSVNKFEPFEELIFLVSVPVCTLKFQKCPIPKILIGLTFYRFLSLRFSEFLSHYSAIYNSEKLKGSSVILKKFNCSNSHNFGQNQNA